MFFLLAIRFGELYLPKWIFGNPIPIWYGYYYYSGIYVLIFLIIWLHRNNLQSLHIDRFFIKLFILLGISSVFLIPLTIGIFPITCALLISIAYQAKKFTFESPNTNDKKVKYLILLIVVPLLYPIYSAFAGGNSINWNVGLLIFTTLYDGLLFLIVFEEILFRALFWRFLENFGLNETKIVVIQALLFWVAHYSYINSIYSFWVSIPFVSLLFGIIVRRSKSITYSLMAHFLYNLIVTMLHS